MTGNYALALPLVVASLTAYGRADFLGHLPVHEALLRRNLRAQHPPALEGVPLLDLSIAAGAASAGRRVRDLGRPPGTIIIALRRSRREEVPTADSLLVADDHITVVVAREASAALPLLRRGTGADRE